MISLVKQDSLLVLINAREAKKFSAILGQKDLDKNSFEPTDLIRTFIIISLRGRMGGYAKYLECFIQAIPSCGNREDIL